jgi:group I intron endonuclease
MMHYKIVDNKEEVRGEIYVIKNAENGKLYVGQALTHRKNHKRYRPFGHLGRFKDHISEALCNTKKKQCRYLNNAIRLYGQHVFSVDLIEVCDVLELDDKERFHIKKLNSMFPNGYNLTPGGKTLAISADTSVIENVESSYQPKSRQLPRGEDTKKRISDGVRQSFTKERRIACMMNAQRQHLAKKLERFRDEELHHPPKMSIIQNTKHGPAVRVIVNKKRVDFIGKHLELDELIGQATSFINALDGVRQHAQIAGNP